MAPFLSPLSPSVGTSFLGNRGRSVAGSGRSRRLVSDWLCWSASAVDTELGEHPSLE